MPERWMVTWDGRPFKKDMTRAEAEAFAERWQRGMLKNGMDKRDYFEIKRDLSTERDFDKRYADYKDNKPQTIIVETGTQ